MPGTMVAGRYRIIGLLGRGGMGEVYHASDVKLGQPVALKFLPAEMEQAEELLQRFLNEVRTALKVTHPSVCRVYDIGEVDGHHYLSMEYVDGEDLKSLLRRVGRLPEDRALEIAREICAGLAAAHEQGILHRDLKPANIMIDGRGKARITDFGLAGLAEGISGSDIRSGTPAYMAPEQLAGKEVTVRSDIYALGLLLYELFTGKRAFKAKSAGEMMRLQLESSPVTPTSLVKGLDPGVERVILRCLEGDSLDRPASALAVSAALPGGDPIAAALAAGETPSPELVAAAGSTTRQPVWVVTLLGSGILVGLILFLFTSAQTNIPILTDPQLEPSVLVNKSRELLQGLGHDASFQDSSYGFATSSAVLQEVSRNSTGRQRQERLAAGWPGMRFWYRQSREPMVPLDQMRMWSDSHDPPRTRPGMVRLWLDMKGRLTFLGIIPEAYDHTPAPATEPDWTPLLLAAGLDQDRLERVPPRWVPNVQTDMRAAWSGPHPDFPEWTIHAEAGAYQGEPNYFDLIYPWERPPATTPDSRSVADRASGMVDVVMYFMVVIVGAILARRNQRLGRGDPRGAFRLAMVMLAVRLIPWILAGHHHQDPSERVMFTGNLSAAVYEATLLWVLYLALEPYFRRLWPRQMISWVRVVAGRWRDPLVGRDILAGILLGIALGLVIDLYQLMPQWLGLSLPSLNAFTFTGEQMLALRSPRHALAVLVMIWRAALLNGFTMITFMVLLTMLTMGVLQRVASRRIWRSLGVAVWVVLLVVLIQPGAGNLALNLGISIAIVGVFTVVLLRFGFLSAILGIAFMHLISDLPMTLDLSAWWARGSFPALLTMALIVGWGVTAALGGRAGVRAALQSTESSTHG